MKHAILCVLFAAGQPGDPPAEEILKRMENGLTRVKDFTVSLDIVAHLEGAVIPPMQTVMYYKAPDRVHFDTQGFALVPKEGVPWSPAWLIRRLRPVAAGNDTLRGEHMFRVVLEPRDDRARTRRVIVWVHPSRWTAEKVATGTVDGRTIEADFGYERVDGVWLPSTLKLSMTSPAADTSGGGERLGPPGPAWRHGFRGGTLDIRYSNYRLNTGLSDELFESRLER